MDPRAVAFLGEHKAEPWFLACSGGADSVFLLHLVYALFPEQRESLNVIHFNHGLRGEASDLDEAFVRKVSGQLRLPFFSATAEGLSGQSEAHLRKARLEYIHSEMSSCGAQVLLQGHQLNDVAETILMRLSRGSTVSGLAAPRPVQLMQQLGIYHIRPLLTVSRKKIQDSLNAIGQCWREDKSNKETLYFRNQIRHQLLPVWENLAPQSLLPAVAQSRCFIEEDDEALDAWASAELTRLINPDPSILNWPTGLPLAIVRRILYQWVLKNQLPVTILSPAILSEVIPLIEQEISCQISLSPTVQLLLTSTEGTLRLQYASPGKPTSWPVTSFRPGCTLYLPNRKRLDYEIVQMSDEIFSELKKGRVDESKYVWLELSAKLQNSLPLFVRQRRPGDQYQPLGMKEPVRLRNQLVNRKVPASERNQLPVVTTSDDQILWCPGCPPAEVFKITDPNTRAIRISYLMA